MVNKHRTLANDVYIEIIQKKCTNVKFILKCIKELNGLMDKVTTQVLTVRSR